MQYSVPQFTDVEDKIIGSLTLKQFGILAGTGAVIFAVYSSSKSFAAAIIMFIVFGIPALIVAFAKINGHPFYNFIFAFGRYLVSPKVLIFDKQGLGKDPLVVSRVAVAPESELQQPAQTVTAELKKLNALLEQQAKAEKALFSSAKAP